MRKATGTHLQIPKVKKFSALLFHSFLCCPVDDKVFPLSDRHNRHSNAVVVNLVNQAVTSVLQLDFVAVGHTGESGRLNSGVLTVVRDTATKQFGRNY